MDIRDVRLMQDVVWTDPDGGEQQEGTVWRIRGAPGERDEDTEIEMLRTEGALKGTTTSVLACELALKGKGQTMKVKLAHCANPDIVGGYWEHPKDSGDPVWVEVNTLREASAACRDFIERNGLGGGNWIGGLVVVPKGRKYYPVARISYNGRAWPPGRDLKAAEIPLDGPIPEIAAGTKPCRVDKQASTKA